MLLVLGLLAWLGLSVGTFGVVLGILLLGFVGYVFAQSALVAHVRGNGVQLSAEQFPDLHGQFTECCDKLGMIKPPEAYVLQGGGLLNAFAAQFLGSKFVVLLSGVVDAMQAHPDGVRFYGHGRLRAPARHGTGFWMSFHELTSGYPWLTKRVARVLGEQRLPGRNPVAYVLAAFVPYAGRLGGGFGLLVMVYLVGMLAAIAIPQYQAYTVKAKLMQAVQASEGVRDALGRQYVQSGQITESLTAAGLPEVAADGSRLSLNPEGMVLTVQTPRGALVFTPHRDDKGGIGWECTGRAPLTAPQLPAGCTVAEGAGKF